MRQSRSRNPTPLRTNENAHRKHLPRRKHAFLWQIMPLLLINSLIQEGEGRRAAITSPFTQTAEGAVKWRQRNEITFLTANELSLLIQRVSLHHWERERKRWRDGGVVKMKKCGETHRCGGRCLPTSTWSWSGSEVMRSWDGLQHNTHTHTHTHSSHHN